jgi:RNA polymerase subunit RPABC4/transcription elongation factor Spt4
MATTTETRTAVCPTHGSVEATREMPKPGWPYLYYLARRALAARRPYQCPTCGATVTTD